MSTLDKKDGIDPTERMRTVRVGDIMISLADYPKVILDCSLGDAIKIMEESQLEVRGIKSLPRVLLVFDRNNQLVGTVRRRDIMRGLEPKFLVTEPLSYRKKLFDVQIDPNLTELSHDRVVKEMRQQAKRLVEEVMLPIEVSVDHDDHILKAIYEVVRQGATLLPVFKDKKVVGVVRSVELFHELALLVV